MSYDAHKNFAVSAVATAPSPALSGTSLVVTAAAGALFPAVPFNATICPANTQPTASNAEIVRVTAISTDTLTIVRAQESSSARTVIVGDQIIAGITAKTVTDIESQLPNGASSSWTPVFTNMVVTSSTVTAKFTQIGKMVFYSLAVVLGGTDKPTGAVSFTLPVTSRAYSGTTTLPIIGQAQYYITNGYLGPVVWVDSTHANFIVTAANGTYDTAANIGVGVPAAWIATNELHASGWYEAA